MPTPRTLHLIGAASSARAYGPGQETAPEAFRRHGLVEALESGGRSVVDVGDVAHADFRVDRDHVEAANVATVATVCRAVARPVAEALGQGFPALVLGGDCTVGLGTMAGALEGSDSVGLIYIDGDTDLNTPATGDRILDWMGVAHLLALPGTEPALSTLARRSPMITPEAIRFVAADNTNDAEQRVIEELGLHRHPLTQCLAEPAAVVESLLDWSAGFARVLVHVDIDVLDGGAFPVADNTRTVPGLTLAALSHLLQALCQAPSFSALTCARSTPRTPVTRRVSSPSSSTSWSTPSAERGAGLPPPGAHGCSATSAQPGSDMRRSERHQAGVMARHPVPRRTGVHRGPVTPPARPHGGA